VQSTQSNTTHTSAKFEKATGEKPRERAEQRRARRLYTIKSPSCSARHARKAFARKAGRHSTEHPRDGSREMSTLSLPHFFRQENIMNLRLSLALQLNHARTHNPDSRGPTSCRRTAWFERHASEAETGEQRLPRTNLEHTAQVLRCRCTCRQAGERAAACTPSTSTWSGVRCKRSRSTGRLRSNEAGGKLAHRRRGSQILNFTGTFVLY